MAVSAGGCLSLKLAGKTKVKVVVEDVGQRRSNQGGRTLGFLLNLNESERVFGGQGFKPDFFMFYEIFATWSLHYQL